MANIRNLGTAIGRLTKDPVVFTNSDGSNKVMVNIAVQENYKNKDGSRPAQFIALEAFISKKAKGLGAYEYMRKGDLVGFEYTVKSNNYTDKNGQTRYEQVLFIQSTDLLETRRSQESRTNNKAVTPAEAAVATQAPVMTEEDVPFA